MTTSINTSAVPENLTDLLGVLANPTAYAARLEAMRQLHAELVAAIADYKTKEKLDAYAATLQQRAAELAAISNTHVQERQQIAGLRVEYQAHVREQHAALDARDAQLTERTERLRHAESQLDAKQSDYDAACTRLTEARVTLKHDQDAYAKRVKSYTERILAIQEPLKYLAAE